MNLERLGVKVEAEVGEDTREYSRRGGVGEYFQIRKGLRQGCVCPSGTLIIPLIE